MLAVGFLDRLTGSPRDGFAAQALRVARRCQGVTDARYDAEKFAIAVWRQGTREPVWLFLSNVYGDCKGAPRAERRQRIERLLQIIMRPTDADTWESAQSRLRPVLRAVTFAQGGVAGMVPPISRPALPYLNELVVVDHPDSMAYVTPQRLESWGVSVEEVFAAARANLAELAERSLRGKAPSPNELVRMVDTGDGYFTSMLLAPGWLAGISERMGTPVVAFVPDTNTVLLCTLPTTGLGKLYELVEQEYGQAVRSLSPVGYTTDARGTVVPYAPPEGHPDFVAARRAEVVLAASEYGTQTQWLSEQYEKAGIEVFVAKLIAASRPGEPAITAATWTDGISTLLPRAQYIAFVRDNVAELRVPWEAVADLVGLQPEPLLSPARYRVDGWPPAEVIDALRQQAI